MHSAMNADHFEVNDLNFTFSYLSLCSNKSTITTEFLVKFLYHTIFYNVIDQVLVVLGFNASATARVISRR